MIYSEVVLLPRLPDVAETEPREAPGSRSPSGFQVLFQTLLIAQQLVYSFLTGSACVKKDVTSTNNPHLAKVEKSDLQLRDRLFVNSSEVFSAVQ